MNQEFTTLSTVLEAKVKLTPMMEQYVDIKKKHPESLLFFRMGDFYELFFEDAIQASRLLNIALTHRGKLGDFPIPMAGIPHHAASNYIDRLTHAGNKVVVCEQLENPKEAKGIVKRGVAQIVSPGIPYDIDKSSHLQHYYIASGIKINDYFYLSYIDFTTGDFFGIAELTQNEFIESLKLNQPKEFIAYFDQWEDYPIIKDNLTQLDSLVTFISSENFNEKYTNHLINKFIPHYKKDKTLNKYKPIFSPIAALCFYINSTQSEDTTGHIKPFRLQAHQNNVKVSYSTLSGLEILPRNRESYKDSLLGFMDKTKSALGARKLKEIFLSPILEKNSLEQRYDFIENCIQELDSTKEHHKLISKIRDLERILVKLNSNKEIAGDFLNIKTAFDVLLELTPIYQDNSLFPSFSNKEIQEVKALRKNIEAMISEEPGAHCDKGNLIKEGYNKKRDRLKSFASNFQEKLSDLESHYRKEFNISNLRVKSNNVAGYFIEVSKSHTSKIPDHFIRKQTLVNSERYQTKELKELELEVFASKDKLNSIERELQKELTQKIIEHNSLVQKSANFLALLDVFISLAIVSFNKSFCRPKIQKTKGIKLTEAFHPLIKENLKGDYTPHNIELNSQHYFGLITGPNMAGKTTVMREVAICQFLAQIGCYIPAKVAQISLCDFIFSRLGASDDILKGQSTFMVEMSETAEILRHATDKSLIILDEIGRGTSTYDGLSIAWALMEYLVEDIKAVTLFSTHYHELIELADELKCAKNLTVKTVKYKGQVRFLYELIEQGATQSFGIHVAELAGLPRKILNRSSQILKRLETEEQRPIEQSFFDNFEETKVEDNFTNPIIEELQALNINGTTPIEALQILNDLKNKLN